MSRTETVGHPVIKKRIFKHFIFSHSGRKLNLEFLFEAECLDFTWDGLVLGWIPDIRPDT